MLYRVKPFWPLKPSTSPGSIPKIMYSLVQVITLESWNMSIGRPLVEREPLLFAFLLVRLGDETRVHGGGMGFIWNFAMFEVQMSKGPRKFLLNFAAHFQWCLRNLWFLSGLTDWMVRLWLWLCYHHSVKFPGPCAVMVSFVGPTLTHAEVHFSHDLWLAKHHSRQGEVFLIPKPAAPSETGKGPAKISEINAGVIVENTLNIAQSDQVSCNVEHDSSETEDSAPGRVAIIKCSAVYTCIYSYRYINT